MTIDERLDRLVERHEALAMTVELLTKDIQDLVRTTAELRITSEQNGKSIADLKIIAQQDGENIRALARIAELHHERLQRLEGEE